MEEKSFTVFYDGGDLPTAKLYRDSETGVIFREFKLDTGLGINPVRICQITEIQYANQAPRAGSYRGAL